jgi:hypothetical protein
VGDADELVKPAAQVRVVLAGAMLIASPAGAASSSRNHCISRCFATWNCYDDAMRLRCEAERNRCVEECRGIPDDPPPVSGGPWGAVAYDTRSGAWGLADESPSREAAKKSALRYCERGGAQCDVVDTFRNTCAAIAVGTDGAVGWSHSEHVRQAGLDAMKQCGDRTKSSTRCFLKLWRCYRE